jgi:hypothetical protein
MNKFIRLKIMDGMHFMSLCIFILCMDIKESSSTNFGSYCNLGNHYKLPAGITYDNKEDTKCFLDGKCYQWVTTEIENYEIKV